MDDILEYGLSDRSHMVSVFNLDTKEKKLAT